MQSQRTSFYSWIISVCFLCQIQSILSSTTASVIDWSLRKPNVCVEDKNYTLLLPDKPREVSAGLKILQLFDFNENLMQFTIQALLMLTWTDPLVNLDGLNLSVPEVVPKYVYDCIWKPDIVFYNCKDSVPFVVTFPNTVAKVMPGGFFYQYSRYNVIVICDLDFTFYPLDSQQCSLYIQFFSSRDTEARLSWIHESPIIEARKIRSIIIHKMLNKLQQFSLEDISPMTLDMIYTSGNTTILDCRFKFKRYTTSSFVNTYVPSLMVVGVSYVSFYLHIKAIPGRVTLCVTAFLTIATQMVSARNALPSVNYITAIDVWLFGCLSLVFLSLIEFTIALALERYFSSCSVKEISLVKDGNDANESRELGPGPSVSQPPVQDKLPRYRGIFKKSNSKIGSLSLNTSRLKIGESFFDLDVVSRRVYPFLVLLFVVAYWVYYKTYCNR